MPSADSEVPALMIDAWNERDLEAMISLADPEIEYVNAPSAVEPGTRRGLDGVREVMRKQWEALPGARQEIERVYERGADIYTAGRVWRPMPDSDARIENRILLGWRVRGGKVTRLAVLGAGSEFRAALEAAGLEHPDDAA